MKLQVPVGVAVSLPGNTARACRCFERYTACVSFGMPAGAQVLSLGSGPKMT